MQTERNIHRKHKRSQRFACISTFEVDKSVQCSMIIRCTQTRHDSRPACPTTHCLHHNHSRRHRAVSVRIIPNTSVGAVTAKHVPISCRASPGSIRHPLPRLPGRCFMPKHRVVGKINMREFRFGVRAAIGCDICKIAVHLRCSLGAELKDK